MFLNVFFLVTGANQPSWFMVLSVFTLWSRNIIFILLKFCWNKSWIIPIYQLGPLFAKLNKQMFPLLQTDMWHVCIGLWMQMTRIMNVQTLKAKLCSINQNLQYLQVGWCNLLVRFQLKSNSRIRIVNLSVCSFVILFHKTFKSCIFQVPSNKHFSCVRCINL